MLQCAIDGKHSPAPMFQLSNPTAGTAQKPAKVIVEVRVEPWTGMTGRGLMEVRWCTYCGALYMEPTR